MVAQYSTNPSNDVAGIFFLWLLFLFGLAFIPATIASNKGHNGVGFYFFGLFFFLPALIVALVIPAKDGAGARVPAAPAPTPPSAERLGRAGLAPPPGPGVVRECPHCKEPMRRDASVCPHCRRESDPWEYREGLWWLHTEQGAVWLHESSQTWRSADEVANAQSVGRYRASLVSLGNDVKAAAKVFREGSNADFTEGALRRIKPGTPIGSALPKEEAEAFKQALADVGTVVEIQLEE